MLLAPASEERNFAMDVISGVLKTRKAESCSLHICVFLIRNHIRDHFLEIFCKFQNTFIKSLFLAALQTIYCKPVNLIKRGLFEISRRVTFRNIPCTLDFLKESHSRSSRYFTKNWLHQRRSYSNFENSRCIQRKQLQWSQFSL